MAKSIALHPNRIFFQAILFLLLLTGLYQGVNILVEAQETVETVQGCTSARRIGAIPFFEAGIVNDAPPATDFSSSICLLYPNTPYYWFQYTVGRRSVLKATVSKQNSFTTLALFSSSTCDRQDFTCIDSARSSSNNATVVWDAIPFESYYLVIGSVDANATFDFSLQILYGLDDNLVENDECATALDLSNNLPYLGQESYFGSFPAIDESSIESCGGDGPPATRFGVWYSIFNPTDRAMIAHSDFGYQAVQTSDFLSRSISIYLATAAGECGSITCQEILTGSSYSRYPYWKAAAGSTNYIYVSGPSATVNPETSDFELTIETPTLELDNGSCNSAFDVTTQMPYAVTTSYIGTFSNYSNAECGLGGIGHPGVWWKVTNTGDEKVAYIASLQNQWRFDHISVFSGPSCDNLACQVYLENGGFKRTLTWQAEAGQTSYIYVWFDFIESLTPTFDISIESRPVLEDGNDQCETALEVFNELPYSEAEGSTYLGGRASSFVDVECRLSASTNLFQYMNSWYQITSDRATNVTISYANLNPNNPNDRVAVFRGESCDQLICLSTGFGASTGTRRWEVSPGETTYIAVHGLLDITAPNLYQLVVDVEDGGGGNVEVTPFPTPSSVEVTPLPTPSPMTSPPTTSIEPAIATALGISQDLFGVSLLTAEEIDHFESSVAGQTDDYWSGRGGNAPVEDVDSNVTVTNRDELMMDSNQDFVTVMYDQTIVYRPTDPTFDDIGSIVSEPFESSESQAEFVIRLRVGGGNLANVTGSSEVRVSTETSGEETSDTPSTDPTSEVTSAPSIGSGTCRTEFSFWRTFLTSAIALLLSLNVFQS